MRNGILLTSALVLLMRAPTVVAQPTRLCGALVVEGAESCLLFRVSVTQAFLLRGNLGSFGAGDGVCVTGQLAECFSPCHVLCFDFDTIAPQSATPTATPTPAPTSIASPAATATATPRAVQIDIGTGIGNPVGTACIPVTLRSSGLSTVATRNDLTYASDYFDLDPQDCALDIDRGRTLSASVIEAAEGMTTVRVVVQAGTAAEPIPDGPLYTCTFAIKASTPPGTWLLHNGSPAAFAPDGTAHAVVTGSDGVLAVSFHVSPCPTRTPPPASCTGDCNDDGVVIIDELVRAVSIVLGSGELDACSAVGPSSDGTVKIDRLLAAVENALNGCVGFTTATPTRTPTPVGDATPLTICLPACPVSMLRGHEAGAVDPGEPKTEDEACRPNSDPLDGQALSTTAPGRPPGSRQSGDETASSPVFTIGWRSSWRHYGATESVSSSSEASRQLSREPRSQPSIST